jgi:hypothetical protein
MPAPVPHPRSLWSRLPVCGTHDHKLAGWTPPTGNPWSTLPVSGTHDHKLGRAAA